MLETDASGNLTGQINPVVNITQILATSPSGSVNPNGFAEIDDLWGFVRSVSTTNTTSNPTTRGLPDATSLPIHGRRPGDADQSDRIPATRSALQTSATFSPTAMWKLTSSWMRKATLPANTVEVQAVENPFPTESGVTPSTALIGPIVSIQTDPAGNPTQLNLWVRDAEPDDTSTIPNGHYLTKSTLLPTPPIRPRLWARTLPTFLLARRIWPWVRNL